MKNVQLVGESAEKTIITYDDHANINKMGTFRTYTVKVEGNDITFKDLTIENNAAPLSRRVQRLMCLCVAVVVHKQMLLPQPVEANTSFL